MKGRIQLGTLPSLPLARNRYGNPKEKTRERSPAQAERRCSRPRHVCLEILVRATRQEAYPGDQATLIK
jgi:hypothetical protein